jgi:hypothetical protein
LDDLNTGAVGQIERQCEGSARIALSFRESSANYGMLATEKPERGEPSNVDANTQDSR